MRKNIFKREIESEFQRFRLENSQNTDATDKILNVLFENPYNTSSQYLLKNEIVDLNNISEVLNSISISGISEDKKSRLVGNIRSIFEMDDDLDLPSKLREQISGKEKIAVFVGSGVSKLMDYPLWSELANNAINYLHTEKIISHAEKERLISEPSSPKHKLSVFHKLLDKKDERSSKFYKSIFGTKSGDLNPYNLLSQIDCLKISINYDCEFWNALDSVKRSKSSKNKSTSDDISYDQPDKFDQGIFDIGDIKTNAIYQIHGSYKSMEKYSIITLSDYLDKYYVNSKNGPGTFLTEVFQNYVMLFIGCGLEEFEIIQHLINPNDEKPKLKHHLLVGTYLGDVNLLRMKKEYFKDSLGINVHGYYLDSSGYDRLYTVLDSWAKRIPSEQSGILKRIEEANGIEL